MPLGIGSGSTVSDVYVLLLFLELVHTSKFSNRVSDSVFHKQIGIDVSNLDVELYHLYGGKGNILWENNRNIMKIDYPHILKIKNEASMCCNFFCLGLRLCDLKSAKELYKQS